VRYDRRVLDQATAKRRVAAAIKLAGTTQAKLGEALSADGLGITDPERIMQGKKTIQDNDATYLAKHTGLPKAWFLEPDLDAVFARAPSEGSGSASVLADADLAEALAELAEAQLQLQRAQELLTHGDPPAGATGSG
jgi:hypothetical protein